MDVAHTAKHAQHRHVQRVDEPELARRLVLSARELAILHIEHGRHCLGSKLLRHVGIDQERSCIANQHTESHFRHAVLLRRVRDGYATADVVVLAVRLERGRHVLAIVVAVELHKRHIVLVLHLQAMLDEARQELVSEPHMTELRVRVNKCGT